MIIYGTMCIKNEGDILRESLEKALEWADKIFVIDNNSKDETPEILRSFSPDVITLAKFDGQFREGLKSIPFNWVNSGKIYPKPDWWAIIDADEIYHENPKDLLKAVPARFSRVCTNAVEFIGHNGTSGLLTPENYNFYIPLDWSESRFYRNIKSLYWSNYENNGFSGVGATYSQRIRLMHFPFRSNEQIKQRLKIRKENLDDTNIAWSNSHYNDEQDLLLNYKKGHRVPVQDGIKWRQNAVNFLAPGPQRATWIVKQIMYYLGFYRF